MKSTETKGLIIEKLNADDMFLADALLTMYGMQTDDEQIMHSTTHKNGMGFNGCDAGILSSFARPVEE